MTPIPSVVTNIFFVAEWIAFYPTALVDPPTPTRKTRQGPPPPTVEGESILATTHGKPSLRLDALRSLTFFRLCISSTLVANTAIMKWTTFFRDQNEWEFYRISRAYEMMVDDAVREASSWSFWKEIVGTDVFMGVYRSVALGTVIGEFGRLLHTVVDTICGMLLAF